MKNNTYGLLLTTSNQTIYTVPDYFNAMVRSIIVTNQTTANVKFNLDWYDSASNTYYVIAKDVTVYGNSFLQITDSLFLQKLDLIRGLASANNAITVSVFADESYIPQKI